MKPATGIVLLFVAIGRPAVGDTASGTPSKIEPRSGLEFIQLPGGTYHYGCEPQDADCYERENPGRWVIVQPFWLGKTSVTVAAYAKCVNAGTCSVPGSNKFCNWRVDGKENHPINCIDWNQATTFCQWIGGRLPTSEEWEYAAKGGESRIYPWGNEAPDESRARFDSASEFESMAAALGAYKLPTGTDPADSHHEGASKHGLLNMSGNVFQWISSADKSKEIRGGAWRDTARLLRASYTWRFLPSIELDATGVRCAL